MIMAPSHGHRPVLPLMTRGDTTVVPTGRAVQLHAMGDEPGGVTLVTVAYVSKRVVSDAVGQRWT